jgi:hypothetical protein
LKPRRRGSRCPQSLIDARPRTNTRPGRYARPAAASASIRSVSCARSPSVVRERHRPLVEPELVPQGDDDDGRRRGQRQDALDAPLEPHRPLVRRTHAALREDDDGVRPAGQQLGGVPHRP